MRRKLSWKDKYILALNEELTVKEIALLRDCGHQFAAKIRDKAIRYAVENGIKIETRYVPTELVFSVTNHDLKYYYDKMVQESLVLSCEGA